MASAPLLLQRSVPFVRRCLLHHHRRETASIPLARRLLRSSGGINSSSKSSADSEAAKLPTLNQIFSSSKTTYDKKSTKWYDADYRSWKDKEAEILQDIEPIICLAKEILHSNRYVDGGRLTPEDEKAVIDKLLVHHPRSEDKIGCGLDSIMVDRHPQFKNSRCLFVVRKDGGWIDFSYQKCLRAYVRDKYPSYANRFIKEHFKRGSG